MESVNYSATTASISVPEADTAAVGERHSSACQGSRAGLRQRRWRLNELLSRMRFLDSFIVRRDLEADGVANLHRLAAELKLPMELTEVVRAAARRSITKYVMASGERITWEWLQREWHETESEAGEDANFLSGTTAKRSATRILNGQSSDSGVMRPDVIQPHSVDERGDVVCSSDKRRLLSIVADITQAVSAVDDSEYRHISGILESLALGLRKKLRHLHHNSQPIRFATRRRSVENAIVCQLKSLALGERYRAIANMGMLYAIGNKGRLMDACRSAAQRGVTVERLVSIPRTLLKSAVHRETIIEVLRDHARSALGCAEYRVRVVVSNTRDMSAMFTYLDGETVAFRPRYEDTFSGMPAPVMIEVVDPKRRLREFEELWKRGTDVADYLVSCEDGQVDEMVDTQADEPQLRLVRRTVAEEPEQ